MPEASPAHPAPWAPVAAVSGRRVLLVEDDADNAEVFAAVIESLGHDVRTACDGFAALALVEKWTPDAVISDLGLPRMSGYELARRMRARPELARAVFVALSGYGLSEDKRRAIEAGFDYYLVKPAEIGALSALLVTAEPTVA